MDVTEDALRVDSGRVREEIKLMTVKEIGYMTRGKETKSRKKK